MRDINRLDNLYNGLKEIHKQLPDWRFCQLMMNFMGWYYQKYKSDCFYLEDYKVLKVFREYIDEMGIKYI